MATIKSNNQWTSATRCKISKKNALYLSLISLSDSISGFVATSCFVVVTECQNSTIQLESSSCRQPWEDDDPGRRSTAIPVANSYRWIVYSGILFVSWLDKSIKRSTKVPLSTCHYFLKWPTPDLFAWESTIINLNVFIMVEKDMNNLSVEILQ